MKNKNIITLMLSIIILFTIFVIPKNFDSIKSYELENLSDNFDILPDQNNGFFLCDKNNSSIKHFYKENDNLKIETICENINFFSAKFVNGNLYVIKNSDLDSLAIFKYNINSNNISSDVIYYFPSLFKFKNTEENIYYNSFALDNNENIYFINAENKLLAKSKYNNENVIEICENYPIVSITTNIENNKLYALTTDKKILIFDISNFSFDNISFKEINGYSDDHFYFLKENIFVSYSGKIYNINKDNNIYEILVSDSKWPTQTVGMLDNYLICKISDNTINCYEKSSDSDKYIVSKRYLCDDKILRISNSKNTCIAILENNGSKYVKFLSINDFKDIPQKNIQTENYNSNSNNSNNTDENHADISDFNISSSLYKIDFQKMIIKNVPIFTTATTFKESIDYSDCNISFKNYLGKNIVTGKLGTGSTVTFEKDGDSITFKIIVSGEISGEGNLNSRDLDSLKDYLGFKSNLLDEFLLSADLNGDGVVNTLDLLLLNKMINNE